MVDRQRLQFRAAIMNRQRVNDLLMMTPHFYRAGKAGRDAAAQLQELELSVDVVFRTLEKRTI